MRGSTVSLLTIVAFLQQGHIRGSIPVSLAHNFSHFKEQIIEILHFGMLPQSGFVQRKSSLAAMERSGIAVRGGALLDT